MTKEEAKHWLNKLYARSDITDEYGDMEDMQPYEEAVNMAIKALEQEPILDKIRAEIVDTLYVDSLIFTELIDFKNGKIDADDVIEEFNRVTRMEVLRIIDKYKPKSEV